MAMNFVFKTITLIIIGFLPLKGCGNSTENQKMEKDTVSTLLSAVSKKDAQQVAKILTAEPNLETKDSSGRTALMIAAYNYDNVIAEMLISAGSNVNAQDDKMNTPFLYAGANGNVALLKMSLKHGANFEVYNRYGGTALIPAAERGHLEVVKLLTNTPNFPIDHIHGFAWPF